ncbi:MAG: T9SS type A sorting domain-containing protein [Ferruginibacter sp.]
MSFCILSFFVNAQTPDFEWRLINPTFDATDPDGGGPATGSVTFTLQIHAVAGTITNITGISTGWCWQTGNAMLPTGGSNIFCGTTVPPPGQPSNVTMSSTFAGLGFTYNSVNQCSGTVNFTTGGQTFDRRSSGTIDGGSIDITTTYIDVFTVTLWSLNNTSPHAGYTVINSGNGAAPSAPGIVNTTYAVADGSFTEYIVASLTYTTPLALATAPLPVLFSSYDVKCSDKGTSLAWSTETELNNSHFEIQKSINGTEWLSIANVNAGANSNTHRDYQYLDLEGGKAFYRIRQVDVNGQSVYTTVKTTACDNRSKIITVYPTPARDKLTVALYADRGIKMDLQLIDATGKIVYKQQAVIARGNNNIVLDVHAIASGQYILTSSDPSIYINKKIIISR